eukprot:984350-Rhodomonas_salina.2
MAVRSDAWRLVAQQSIGQYRASRRGGGAHRPVVLVTSKYRTSHSARVHYTLFQYRTSHSARDTYLHTAPQPA